jgi:hypothetical protein
LTDAGKKRGVEDTSTVGIVKIAGVDAHLHPLKRFALKLLKQAKEYGKVHTCVFSVGIKRLRTKISETVGKVMKAEQVRRVRASRVEPPGSFETAYAKEMFHEWIS